VKLALSLVDAALSLAAALVLVLSPLSLRAAEFAAGTTSVGALQWLVYAALVGGGFLLLGLPLAFVSGYLVEHRFGLSNQTLGAWVREQGKGMALLVGLGTPLLLGFRALVLGTGAWWGLAVAVAFFAVTVLLVRLAPTLLMPIFFQFKPLENPALAAAIGDICRRGGLALEGVYQFDMSKNTRKANAAFTGLGKTKRVILGDTLLAKFSVDEIRAVVAHEVGHFTHAHLVKGLAANGVLTTALFLLAQAAYGALAPRLGYGPAGDLAGLPLIFLVLGVAGFVSQPLSNALSRAFEREADRYAFATTGPTPMADALRRLAEQNLADVRPNPVVEFLFHSHPSVAKRIAAADAFRN
jgi:STE24 endopeptidase